MDLKLFENYDTVYITGHKNPDADSLVSAKIMCDILTASGINAVWVFFDGDEIGKGDDRLLNDVMAEKPQILHRSDIGDKKFLLVDHNDVSQSVGSVKNVIAAIDHHVPSGQIQHTFMSDYCCTALYIYMMFKDRYNFSEEQKTQIFRAVLSDSVFGKSSRYKQSDTEALKVMGFDPDFEYYFKKYFLPTKLENIPEIFATNGLKTYDFGTNKLKSTYIYATDTEHLSDYRSFVENYDGSFVGIWIDYSVPKTYVYFKHKGVMQTFEYDCIASRAATIMPQIVKLL